MIGACSAYLRKQLDMINCVDVITLTEIKIISTNAVSTNVVFTNTVFTNAVSLNAVFSSVILLPVK